MAGNQEVTDLPVIPAVDGADVYAAKNNLDYRIRTGEAGGLATLDGSGKVPASQLSALPLTGGTLTGPIAIYTGAPAAQATYISYGKNNSITRWATLMETDNDFSLYGFDAAGANPRLLHTADYVTGVFTVLSGDLAVGGPGGQGTYSGFGRGILVQSTSQAALELASTRADASGALLGIVGANYRTNAVNHQRLAEINFVAQGATANQRGGNISFHTKPNASTTLTERGSFSESGQFTVTNGQFVSGTTNTFLTTTGSGQVFLRPAGLGSATGQVIIDPSYSQFVGNMGIGTIPGSVPGIGNPLFGTSNIIQYSPGDVQTLLLSDGSNRQHIVGFGAAGIGVFDAGLRWLTSDRILRFHSGAAQRGTLDTSGNFAVTGTSTGTMHISTGGEFRGSPSVVVVATSAGGGSVVLRPNGSGSATGEVIIGPGGAVSANGTITTQGQFTSAGASAGFQFNDRTSGRGWLLYGSGDTARIFNGGSGVLDLTPTGNLSITGTGTGVNWIATSDENLKKEIEDRKARARLPDLLRFVSFLWKANNKADLGLIAQEVREVAPEYVYSTVNEEGVETLSVDKASLALECVIGLAARVRELEEKI